MTPDATKSRHREPTRRNGDACPIGPGKESFAGQIVWERRACVRFGGERQGDARLCVVVPYLRKRQTAVLCRLAVGRDSIAPGRGKSGDRGRAKRRQMTETEKLLRDIQTLRESIQIDWADLDSNPLREEERKNIRMHLELCQTELKNLIERLLALDEDNSN